MGLVLADGGFYTGAKPVVTYTYTYSFIGCLYVCTPFVHATAELESASKRSEHALLRRGQRG